MDKLFMQIVNMSITSSYIILFIIAARFFLKKLPKIFSYVLWVVPLIRLIFPFSFESIFSLISINTKTIPEDIIYTQIPQIQSGIAAIDSVVNRRLPQAITGASANPMQIWISIGSILWLAGLALLLIYSIYTTLRLSRSLKSANYLYDNIYEIDTIKTAFVFGLIKPRIYLPNNLSDVEKSYIIKHEETHIKRLDHITKFLAFLVVSIHWFNPLVWFAFYLMGEDMELSCDESVIKEMGYGIKKDYSNSLLSLSIGKRIIGGSPIAFGENNTKGRIKNILNYKKPKFWMIVVAVIILIALAVGLLSNPLENQYKIDETKIVQINIESSLHGGIRELDDSIWSNLIEEINSAKWSKLSEEDWPDQDRITQNIIITLARDESVDNKEYVLTIYRDKHKKLLGQEYEHALVLAYNDQTDDIKTWRLSDDLQYKIWDILGASNEDMVLDDWASMIDGETRKSMTVEDYAKLYIDNEIQMYEGFEWGDFKIIDQEITRLEKLSTFDHILSSSIELWVLDFRLKPENTEDIVLAGGLGIVDGWLVDNGITGRPHLTFTYDSDDSLRYLGNANIIEFNLDTLAAQEIAIRIMLENKGVLPNVTYEGNHGVIKSPLSTGETCQLLLSQPVVQGDGGIWAVERWMDGNGTIYYELPNMEEDIRIEDYYKGLQDQVDGGQNTWLLDPAEAAYNYIINVLGQTQVEMDDLEVIHPATIDDFLITPESHYIGYITMMTLEERLFHLDQVEFLTSEDEERANELGIDTNMDMPSGFYIYNRATYPYALDVSEETEYLILSQDEFGVSSGHISLTKEEFVEYNDSLGYDPLYHVYTKDGYVTSIVEQYIP